MRACLPVLSAALLLGACQREPKATQVPVEAPTATATLEDAPPPAALSEPGEPRRVRVSNNLYEFRYSYPAEAGGIPALKGLLDADLASRREELIGQAKDGRAEARDAGVSYTPYGAGWTWETVTDLPDWLSLSAETYSFTGGAHPNSAFDALLWDKSANRRRNPKDLFLSKAALSAAIRETFCKLLDQERAKKRGEPVSRASGNEFDACIDPANQTIVLGSSNEQTFDRIGVLVAPYEAGPYAEGAYEITVPVTPLVVEAVRPEYRQSFTLPF